MFDTMFTFSVIFETHDLSDYQILLQMNKIKEYNFCHIYVNYQQMESNTNTLSGFKQTRLDLVKQG